MEHIFITILTDLYLNVTNTTTILLMVLFAYATSNHSNLTKYRYVLAFSAIIALGLTLWAYLFLALPDAARTTPVVVYVYIIRLLSAIFWGTTAWLVFRQFRRKGVTVKGAGAGNQS